MIEITRASSERDVLIATLYGEARTESEETALEWLVWMIKNRAQKNKPHWGGSRIKDICLHLGNFDCWVTNPRGIVLSDKAAADRCAAIVDRVLSSSEDPTQGCDNFNKPNKDLMLLGTGYPHWTKSSVPLKRFGEYLFYRSD